MPNMDSLAELLQDELKDIYDAEKQLTKALPKLAKKASSEELRSAIDDHLRETEEHVRRLEQVFDRLDMPVKGKKCTGMQHLIGEGNDMLADAEDPAIDALMIAGAQKVEHYEIAAYGTLRTWANRLGKGDIAAIFEKTLEEEKEADRKLTEIAESLANEQAAEGGDAEEQEMPAKRTAARGRAAAPRRQTAADRSARRRR